MKRVRDDDPPPRQVVTPAQRLVRGVVREDINALIVGNQYYLYDAPPRVGGFYLPTLKRLSNVIFQGLVSLPAVLPGFGAPQVRLRFTYADGPHMGQDRLVDPQLPVDNLEVWSSHLPQPAVEQILQYNNRSGGKKSKQKRKQRKTKRRK